MQRRPGTVFIGSAPTGSKFIRFATPDDLRADAKRIGLFETPDGEQIWISNDRLQAFEPNERHNGIAME